MAVVIGADITTDGSGLQRQLKRDAATIERTLGGAFKSVGKLAALPFTTVSKLASATTGLIGKLTSIDNIVRGTAVAIVGKKIFDSIDRTIKITGALEVQVKGLANQTGKTTRQVEDYIASVNNASMGLLDFKVAAELANRALLLGVPQKSIADLTKYVSLIATANGESERAEEQIKTLLQAIATGRTQSLLAFGVQLDLSQFEGLGPQERQLGIFQEALSQLEQKAKRLKVTGDEIFFVYTGIFGNLADIRAELGKSVTQSERIKGIIKAIADLTGGIAQSLRDFGIEETVGPLFEKLLQVGGAFAADLGEAIAIGIGRGVKGGLELLGFSLADVFGPDLAAAIDEGIAKSIDFGRTRQRVGELGGTFAPRGIAGGVLDPEVNRRESRDAQDRLRTVNRALADPNSEAFRAAIRATRADTGLDRGELRAETIKRLTKEQETLRGGIGFGNPNFDASVRSTRERVSETTGTDANDTIGQRIGKSIVSGFLTGQSELQAVFITAFDEGMASGFGKIAGSVGDLIADGATAIADSIFNIDWVAVGNSVGRGIYEFTAGKAGEAADAITGATGPGGGALAGEGDSILGQGVRGISEDLTKLLQLFSVEDRIQEADFADEQRRQRDAARKKDPTLGLDDAGEKVSSATDAVNNLSLLLDQFATALS